MLLTLIRNNRLAACFLKQSPLKLQLYNLKALQTLPPLQRLSPSILTTSLPSSQIISRSFMGLVSKGQAPLQSQNGLVFQELFEEVERTFPASRGNDKWYLTAIAALIASGQAKAVGSLYTYLTSKEQYHTSEQRQQLVRRLREAMIKCIILSGIPGVMEAIASVAAVELEQDKDHSILRQHGESDQILHRRGVDVLDTLFKDDNKMIGATLGSHKEISWISIHLSYGYLLAEHRILDIIETELVVLPAIMSQNLRDPSRWHIRACMRIGLTREEISKIQEVTQLIAAHAGLRLDNVESVSDVEDP